MNHFVTKSFVVLSSIFMITAPLSSLETPIASAAQLEVTSNKDQYATPSQQSEFQTSYQQYKNDIPVQFLGINDFHGGLSTTGTVNIGDMSYKSAGTAARLASYLDKAQTQFVKTTNTFNSFRVEAGDMVGASPANSSLLAHESTMHALEAMNLQIGTLGNHEFDRGLPEFNRILTGGTPDSSADQLVQNYPHYSSDIDITVANVVNKSDGKIPFGYQPYTIRTVMDRGRTSKIGFIGIETSDLPSLTLYNNYKDYVVLDEATTIAKYEKILQDQGVNAVVVMAHTGVETDSNGQTTGTVVNILNKLNDIDPDNNVGLYVAGHSHQYANATVGKTKVVQAVYTGKSYDDVWGYINPETGKFDNIESHVYPVLSKADDPTTLDNPKVANIVQDADNRVASKVNEVIGKAAEPKTITGRLSNSSTMENAVGELVVDGQLYEGKKQGLNPDFAMTNTGGVRDDLKVADNSDITWGSATSVQPFGNILQVVTMTGQQIENALNQQYNQNQQYYLQIAGLKYTYSDTNNPDQPYEVTSMMADNGETIQKDKTYRVVINDFLHGGGDDFSAFKDTTIVGSIGSDTDTFVQYIKDMTEVGTPVKAPNLDRKIYNSNEMQKAA